ncbi:hypothetical protein [Streptomyces sp. RFCAC02]|uniref:hypothetical protein n=1 Tax=Streptomyces sp. RFCAC02 TaxID=2499143 RepID=UPI001F1143F8|nr:hypothetical protein [Streptomyces sp. RFCAC02]
MNPRVPQEPPAVDWQDSIPVPFRLVAADAGVHLGTDRAGRAVTLPIGPEPRRVAVLGESLFGRLFGLRMLAVGARVTAATRVPDQWQSIARVAGDRLTVADGVSGWPARQPAPPTREGGPQVLVCDLRRPPSAALADGPWRTVLHVTRDAPRRSHLWSEPDALLALDARFAGTAGRLLGGGAARVTASLAPGEIALFRSSGSEILRPDVSPGETALLTPDLR